MPIAMRKGEHRTRAFRAKNPSGKIPVLELEDGTCIAESVAICRYFEALVPQPPLFGQTPLEIAEIEMWNRRMELDLFGPIGTSWVNGPVVARLFGGRFDQIPAAKARSDEAVRRAYAVLNEDLDRRPYIAGDGFSVADITALCAIDFAAKLVELAPDEAHEALWAWHARVSSRPSALA